MKLPKIKDRKKALKMSKATVNCGAISGSLIHK